MSITGEQVSPSAWVITLVGELGLASAPELRDAIAGIRRGSVVFDLSDAVFIDSSIVTEIAGAVGQVSVVIAAPPDEQPRRVLDMAGVSAMAKTVDARQDALWLLQDE